MHRDYRPSPHFDEVQNICGSYLGLRSGHYLDGARTCGRVRLRITTIRTDIDGQTAA